MSKSVILPGSYDPITVGHLNVVKEALAIYDRVFVVAFINPEKKYLFTPEERLSMLCIATEGMEGVTVDYAEGLVIDYARENGIDEILKGYRNDSDLEYERAMAEWNKKNGGIDTVFIKCKDEYARVSSTAVREALAKGRIPFELLPDGVGEFISKKTLNI